MTIMSVSARNPPRHVREPEGPRVGFDDDTKELVIYIEGDEVGRVPNDSVKQLIKYALERGVF